MNNHSSSLLCWTLAALLVVLGGCGSSGQGTSSDSGGSPYTITQEEIQKAGTSSNAYNLVRRLEPQWLQKRGRNSIRSPGDIRVYVQGNRQGGPGALRQIDMIDVKSIQFLQPDEATMRYGSGHDNGAILVNLKGQ